MVVSKNQNTICLNGSIYLAEETEHRNVKCSFCDVHNESKMINHNCIIAPCSWYERNDKKDVVFKLYKRKEKIKIKYGTSILEVKNGKESETVEHKCYYVKILFFWYPVKIKFKIDGKWL